MSFNIGNWRVVSRVTFASWVGVLVGWVDALSGWEDVVVRVSPPGVCERGQLYFIPLPNRKASNG